MLRMDLFCVVLSAEMFCCVSEDNVVVKDVWHVSMVGVKLMCGVFSVLSLLFCSSICCLWDDLSLLGFDRAMFGDLKK
jgi:hypothetical protein